MEDFCGFEVSSGQVFNLNKQLDEEFAKWRTRPLPEIRYLILDATCYKVRIDGTVRDCATLIHIDDLHSIDEMWACLPLNLPESATVEAIGRRIKETVVCRVSRLFRWRRMTSVTHNDCWPGESGRMS